MVSFHIDFTLHSNFKWNKHECVLNEWFDVVVQDHVNTVLFDPISVFIFCVGCWINILLMNEISSYQNKANNRMSENEMI